MTKFRIKPKHIDTVHLTCVTAHSQCKMSRARADFDGTWPSTSSGDAGILVLAPKCRTPQGILSCLHSAGVYWTTPSRTLMLASTHSDMFDMNVVTAVDRHE